MVGCTPQASQRPGACPPPPSLPCTSLPTTPEDNVARKLARGVLYLYECLHCSWFSSPLFSDAWQNSLVKCLTAAVIIYSPHIHGAFHFAQLSPRNSLWIFHHEGTKRMGEKIPPHHNLAASPEAQPDSYRDAYAAWRPASYYIYNNSLHLSPFFRQATSRWCSAGIKSLPVVKSKSGSAPLLTGFIFDLKEFSLMDLEFLKCSPHRPLHLRTANDSTKIKETSNFIHTHIYT